MKNKIFWFGLTSAICVAIQMVAADPYCHVCPYNCGSLGLGKKDCSELSRGTGGLCCVDLTQKGLKLAAEQDRVVSQSKTGTYDQSSAENCPRGFHPSENKCTSAERQNGCKDIRLPNGLGCVNR